MPPPSAAGPSERSMHLAPVSMYTSMYSRPQQCNIRTILLPTQSRSVGLAENCLSWVYWVLEYAQPQYFVFWVKKKLDACSRQMHILKLSICSEPGQRPT